jgi:hypothetical protein
VQPGPQADANATLYDYLYVDRERIGAYHTQLLGMGVPLTSKYSQGGSSTESEAHKGGIPKVYEGAIDSQESVNHSTEHSFDPAWPMVLQTVDELIKRNLIHEPAEGIPVGALIKCSGILTVVDLKLLSSLWDPLMTLFKQQSGDAAAAVANGGIGDFVKAVALPIVFQIMTTKAQSAGLDQDSLTAWGILRTENVVGSAETFALMNGGIVPGRHHVIGVLDVGTLGHEQQADAFTNFTPTNTYELMLGMQNLIRNIFGRPNYANGVTPLLIYRDVQEKTPAIVPVRH